MGEGAGLLAHLPQQWLGIGATLLFAMYMIGQIIEKSEKIAKILPFGKWWHQRQSNQRSRILSPLVTAVEENEVIRELRKQIDGVLVSSADLNDTLRCSRAYSAYEARWHFRHDVENASVPGHRSAEHLDYFEFEKVWQRDSTVANQLLT